MKHLKQTASTTQSIVNDNIQNYTAVDGRKGRREGSGGMTKVPGLASRILGF